MEASALRYAEGFGRNARTPLLRLQSDERLIALVRRGNAAAFEVLVARYQSRLLAFCRHLLGSKEDAEDVLQEVMTSAFNAMVADERPINVRPWLYRIARNRCLNQLRRAQPVGVDSMDVHFSDFGASTADKVHMAEEFRLLVGDIQGLAETQRTALVLREMDALSYEQIAEAMETTVSSVKSLLVRARISLAEASEARRLSCDEVRIELAEVAEGLQPKPSALVRRHLRCCSRCRDFQGELKRTTRALAALLPVGPLAVLKQLLTAHLPHHAGSGAAGAGVAGTAVSSSAAVGGGILSAGSGGMGSVGVGAIAGKAAAGLAAAMLVTAGAVEVSAPPAPRPAHARAVPAARTTAPARRAPLSTTDPSWGSAATPLAPGPPPRGRSATGAPAGRAPAAPSSAPARSAAARAAAPAGPVVAPTPGPGDAGATALHETINAPASQPTSPTSAPAPAPAPTEPGADSAATPGDPATTTPAGGDPGTGAPGPATSASGSTTPGPTAAGAGAPSATPPNPTASAPSSAPPSSGTTTGPSPAPSSPNATAALASPGSVAAGAPWSREVRQTAARRSTSAGPGA